ncbi:hypothetical protein SAMN05421770_101496 [Granulicella rosea]|uniref:Streptogramin lyase n=1 Tax=Granulicella rosea TaxID=474952 RepID=A0A239DJZ0_9BACT|nr:NHL repeat-containing protein [Granulicella rosea]SNS32331.1 hypothetical protein SAMN05421770_101496 [Granulicella rosea]
MSLGRNQSILLSAPALFILFCTLGLAGCGLGTANFPESSPVGTPAAAPGGVTQGILHGGQQPIVGSHVFLFAANTTGNGGSGIAASPLNASISLLKAASNTTLDTTVGGPTSGDYYVTTDPSGAFTITGDYTCPANSPQVYLYAVGGNPGAGVANSAAGSLAALGTCPYGGTLATATPAVTYIYMNEVSTVAAAYSLAPFASDATHISSSGSALAVIGITNAFKNAANLENLATGAALTTTPALNGGNGAVPQTMIDTLANILAACVNSTGPSGVGCSTLLPTATSDGTPSGVQPTDTATAAINIAHHPGVNQTALYDLQLPASPFQPSVSGTSPPNDFTLAISFTWTSIGPAAVAVDGSGNVWVANNVGSTQTVMKLSSVGAFLSTAPGYSAGSKGSPTAIAIDESGNAWIANSNYQNIGELSSSGNILSGTGGYSVGASYYPYALAIDSLGRAWEGSISTSAGEPSNVDVLSTTGAILFTTGSSSVGALEYPQSIAIDGAGSAWVANANGSAVTKLSSTDTVLSGTTGFTGGGLTNPKAIAIDHTGNAWVTSGYNPSSVVEFSPSGAVLSGASGYLTGSYASSAIAIDGSSNVWAGTSFGIVEFSNGGTRLSPAGGFYGINQSGYSSFDSVLGIAVDGSGDVWVASQLNSSLVEIVGAATPVVTPLCANLVAPYLAPASRP